MVRGVGKEGAFEGGGGMNESYVVDGRKDNDVISIAQKCVLRWPISIVSGAFERNGQGTKGTRGGEEEGGDELQLRHGWL